VQPQDVYADCTMIRAEIEGNNVKMKELADERGWKVTQNVVTGLAGFVVPLIWFGMDWKGSVDKDAAALQARQQYLTTLAEQRCAPGYGVLGFTPAVSPTGELLASFPRVHTAPFILWVTLRAVESFGEKRVIRVATGLLGYGPRFLPSIACSSTRRRINSATAAT
jgi:hypothetical protein